MPPTDNGRKMTSQEKTSNKYAVPAVEAMLDILEYMSDKSEPCGVTEMSKELGVTNNLAFRVMKCLVERGYAEVNNAGLYQLSTGFFSLGMKLYSRFELRRRARPHLEALCAAVNTTCQLQVPEGENMLVMDVITPEAPFFIQVVPGTRLNYHCNAFGKAVLAFKSEEYVKELLPSKLSPLTPHSRTGRAEFLKELEQVRQTGIAYDREEYNLGFFCIGAPVFNVAGEPIGGLGLTGLSTLFPHERYQEAEKLVLKCAQSVSLDIGYQGNFFQRIKI